ncbi:MAG: alpha/beta hydrolase [Alphaproteobacteria bacterium]
MALHPQTQELLDQMNEVEAPPIWEQPLDELRTNFNELVISLQVPGPQLKRVENRAIPGPHGAIPVRIYWPDDAGSGPLPVFVHFHGSGFVVLGLDSHDNVCRELAQGAGCIVVAVDYRKAPENKFPKPTDDSWAATLWVVEHCAELGGDAERIALGGDSAGGCIAAVVAQRAAREGAPKIAFQLLIYPVTDMSDDTESYRRFAEGFSLTADMMRWFVRTYLNSEEEKANPTAAPLRAADLSGVAPALVITASHDPRLDEGIAYGEKMRAAGVRVTHSDYAGQIHGFWNFTGRIDAALEARAEACAALRAAFASA